MSAVRTVVLPGITVGDKTAAADPVLRDKVAALLRGTDLSYCFQCGVCTGSCPTVDRMEYGPRRIMHMVYLGMAEQVLRSDDIWKCVSCYSCASRCPQGIEITEVMTSLRSLAVAEGLTKDKEATFSQIFVKVLSQYGRMFEPEVLVRYDATGISPRGLLTQAGLGLRMFRKGKIGMRPTRIENAEEVGRIVAWAREETGP